jgi:hypothetical protein
MGISSVFSIPKVTTKTSHQRSVWAAPHHTPDPKTVFALDRMQNPIVNLLGITVDRRAQFMAELFPKLQELRARTGRPHWIVVDEMHHMFPAAWVHPVLPCRRG